MKIVADENIPLVENYFSNIGEVVTKSGRLICQSDVMDADILLVRSVTAVNSNLLRNTNVRFVASATSGINHINIRHLEELNIGFAHAAGSNANSVAQYVISAICYWSLIQDRSIENLNIGIIGYGNVGKKLKQYCDLLGFHTIVNDPPFEEFCLDSTKFSSINKALSCDVVSFHVPLTRVGSYPTFQFINDAKLQLLKPDALFINSSRGEVIDEEALLMQKKVRNGIQLVLDVWQNEPHINTRLMEKCLLATPHIAGYSYDGKIAGTRMIYQSCCDYFNLPVKPYFNDDLGISQQKISSTGRQDLIKEILEAYDISQDSYTLKRILSDNNLKNGGYFDSLRKNYPIRREWIF